jgi:hypothetical protein
VVRPSHVVVHVGVYVPALMEPGEELVHLNSPRIKSARVV